MSLFGTLPWRRIPTVAVLLASALTFAATAPLNAQTPVDFGDTITEPGVYFLRGNQSGNGPGIRIESDDVALLFLRFTLRGDGGDVGVSAIGHDNVVIYGGRITNFKVGMSLNGGEHCTVKDMRIDHCFTLGLDLNDIDESWFLRMRTDNNGADGVTAVGCDDNRFISILSHDNEGDGLRLGEADVLVDEAGGTSDADSNDNKVRLCWLSYNGGNGLDVLDSDDNDVERNQCVANLDAGIRLHAASVTPSGSAGPTPGGPNGNYLRSNWCVFNTYGIVVEEDAVDNTLTNNTALANTDFDFIDANPPPCDNTWFLNFFLTKIGDGEDCIF